MARRDLGLGVGLAVGLAGVVVPDVAGLVEVVVVVPVDGLAVFELLELPAALPAGEPVGEPFPEGFVPAGVDVGVDAGNSVMGFGASGSGLERTFATN